MLGWAVVVDVAKRIVNHHACILILFLRLVLLLYFINDVPQLITITHIVMHPNNLFKLLSRFPMPRKQQLFIFLHTFRPRPHRPPKLIILLLPRQLAPRLQPSSSSSQPSTAHWHPRSIPSALSFSVAAAGSPCCCGDGGAAGRVHEAEGVVFVEGTLPILLVKTRWNNLILKNSWSGSHFPGT